VPSTTAESITWEAERAELRTVLESPLFTRSPTLSHLLSYLCEKTFAGETDQIKEYSVALDVFGRRDSFDQDTDSIVRVQANRLRKRLGEYYAANGANHSIHITIPLGQYVPQFQEVDVPTQTSPDLDRDSSRQKKLARVPPAGWIIAVAIVALAAVLTAAFLARKRPNATTNAAFDSHPSLEPSVGLPVGDDVHLLAGSKRKYVDHAGKLWSPDAFFLGGNAVQSAVQHIWRTQDPIIYRSSRQGDFAYNIPLKPGTYELHLHFAETFYGPENSGGGGEGSRTMTVTANGQPLLRDFDVLADAGDGRTAEVKVFTNLSPADDGQLHLTFSGKNGSAMVSAIEVLPGVKSLLRPVRIVARDVPYYSNDSHWWSPDTYFKGGQLASSPEPTLGTDDPEFYETERWGHFSYAIPVVPGRYTVTLHFIEHHAAGIADRAPVTGVSSSEPSQERVFNVFCNGRTVIDGLDIVKEVGQNHPLVRKIKDLEPNAQGKLLLEFVPVTRYATVSAIEVMPE
jgi:hypothetical protein